MLSKMTKKEKAIEMIRVAFDVWEEEYRRDDDWSEEHEARDMAIKIEGDLITSACFFDRPDIWYNDNRINHERNCLTDIVAWMPLLKPYKVKMESEEDNCLD